MACFPPDLKCVACCQRLAGVVLSCCPLTGPQLTYSIYDEVTRIDMLYETRAQLFPQHFIKQTL